jgi:hypothetical protein
MREGSRSRRYAPGEALGWEDYTMNVDMTTKILLALVAAGIWLNVAVYQIRPAS